MYQAHCRVLCLGRHLCQGARGAGAAGVSNTNVGISNRHTEVSRPVGHSQRPLDHFSALIKWVLLASKLPETTTGNLKYTSIQLGPRDPGEARAK